MGAYESWFAPVPGGRGMAARSALVIMADPHPAVATTLILQEMGLTVDVGSEPNATLDWLRRAHYDAIVAGGSGIGDLDYAARLRDHAPDARIILFADPTLAAQEAVRLGVEVILPPHDVNALVERFLPHAA
jgi:hypothetical protein